MMNHDLMNSMNLLLLLTIGLVATTLVVTILYIKYRRQKILCKVKDEE